MAPKVTAPCAGKVNGNSSPFSTVVPSTLKAAVKRTLILDSSAAGTASRITALPATGAGLFFSFRPTSTGPKVSRVAKVRASGWPARSLPAKSFTPLMLAVKVAFGGRGTCGTKVRTRLFTPSEVVPATSPDGPVRVITAPGWTGSSKDSRTTVVTSTCSVPFPGVALSRPGARWSRVLKVALNKAGRVRPTRSRGPRLVTWPVAFNNSPTTTMS